MNDPESRSLKVHSMMMNTKKMSEKLEVIFTKTRNLFDKEVLEEKQLERIATKSNRNLKTAFYARKKSKKP